MTRINVSLSPEIEDFIVEMVEYGEFKSAGEVANTALRDWAKHCSIKLMALHALREAIFVGDDSGPSVTSEIAYVTIHRIMYKASPGPHPNLTYSPAALADLIGIKLDLVIQEPKELNQTLLELEDIAAQIAAEPDGFVSYGQIRGLLRGAHHDQYVIFYRQYRSEEIRVVRIFRNDCNMIRYLMADYPHYGNSDVQPSAYA